MYIKLQKSSRGFSLLETMISTALFAVAIAIVMTVYLYSTKTFAMLANYAQLDQNNRVALDKMTRELRGAQTIVTNNANSITLSYPNGTPVTYLFEPNSRALIREAADGSSILLTNCDLLSFTVGQRNVTNGTFDSYLATPGLPVKEIQFSWKTTVKGGVAHSSSENIQTAKIIVRMAGAGELYTDVETPSP
jgi:prepilin-type N-terminal cleavage/methylation domain-containing protein